MFMVLRSGLGCFEKEPVYGAMRRECCSVDYHEWPGQDVWKEELLSTFSQCGETSDAVLSQPGFTPKPADSQRDVFRRP